MAKYEQLKAEERHYIQVQRQLEISITAIAKALNRPKSTISRELQRNTSEAGYCFGAAQKLAQMRHAIKTKVIRWTEEIAWDITDRLLKKWSPEQIVDDLRTKNKPFVCVERIYQFIREDKLAGGKLYLNLRHATASYARGKNKSYKGKIKDRVDISERPSVVDDKLRVGDWEADTMVGKGHQGFLVTLTERFSKFNLAVAVPSKEAEVVKDAILKALSPFKNYVHTRCSSF